MPLTQQQGHADGAISCLFRFAAVGQRDLHAGERGKGSHGRAGWNDSAERRDVRGHGVAGAACQQHAGAGCQVERGLLGC